MKIFKSKIFHILWMLTVILTFALAFSRPAFADDFQKSQTVSCPSSTVNKTTPTAAGLFSDDVLIEMNKLMKNVYKNLAKIMLLGHSLVTYSNLQGVHHCFKLSAKSWFKNAFSSYEHCSLAIPDLNFFICGIIIYLVGFFMSLSIGLYFVDICFKLGFAVIFLPISIALWPFKPTSNKFGENLHIIVRNAMLFTLVAIGTSFAVILIQEGIEHKVSTNVGGATYGDGTAWGIFEQIIEDADKAGKTVSKKENEAIVNNSVTPLGDLFSLFSISTLVIFFCLFYGFRILGSSVNDYLGNLFSDPAFGSESPVHHLTTAAVGNAVNNFAKPVASYVKDVATHGTGKVFSGLGAGIAKIGSSGGRSTIKQGLGRITGKMRTNAEGVKNKIGGVTAKAKAATMRRVDKIVPPEKRTKLMAAAKAKAAAASETTKQAAAVAGAAALNAIGGGGNISAAQVRLAMHKSKQGIKGMAGAAKALSNPAVRAQIMEKTKQKIASTGASMINNMAKIGSSSSKQAMGAVEKVSAEQVRQGLHKAKMGLETLAKSPAKVANITGKGVIAGAKGTNKLANESALSLQPSSLVKGLGNIADDTLTGSYKILTMPPKAAIGLVKSIVHPKKTFQTLKNASFKGIKSGIGNAFKDAASSSRTIQAVSAIAQTMKQNKDADGGAFKFAIKGTGRIVAKTVKGTGEDTAKVIGGLLKGFGDKLADNSKKEKRKPSSFAKLLDELDEEKGGLTEEELKQQEAEFYRDLGKEFEQ